MRYYAVLGTLPFKDGEENVIYTGSSLFHVHCGSLEESVIELTRNNLYTKKELLKTADVIIKSKNLDVSAKDLISHLITSGIYGCFPAINKRFSWLKFSSKAHFALPFVKDICEDEAKNNPEMYRSWLQPEYFFSKLEQSMLNYLIFQQRECLKDIFGDDYKDKIRGSYPEYITEHDLSADLGIFHIPKYKDVPDCAINAGICNLFMQRCLIVLDRYLPNPLNINLSKP